MPVQKPYPAYIQIYRPEVLLHPALYDIWSCCVEHVAVAVVDLWKQDCFINACGVFKGYKLHGIPCLCTDGLARYKPAGHGDLFSHILLHAPGLNMIHLFQHIRV